MSAIILQDDIVHYEVLGRGRPILFLHGWVGSWRYWIPSMQTVSTSFRTYALDFRGFGDSAKKAHYYSIEQQIHLLEDFINELGIGKIALVGHGLGAIIALIFTQRYPDQVDRVMAIGMPNSQEAINARLRSVPPTELAGWLLANSTMNEVSRVEAPKADQNAILLSLTTLSNIDLPGLGRKIPNPCLYVHGANDPVIESPEINKNGSLPEKAHLIIFEGAGHFPMLDEPSKFNRLLTDFLNIPPGTSPRGLQLKEEWKRRVR
jgi:pimeloyl-ACP methyl ester carboxylesterase